jgi:predicted RNA-binding Zn ribbon-like protein
VRFSSHLDSVVAVAVSLVNVLTPGEAHGREYQPPGGPGLPGAVAGALSVGQRDPRRPVPPQDAAELAAFAPELRMVFTAVADGDVDAAARQVNSLLGRTGARPALDNHDEQGWHLHFHGSDDGLATGWAAGCVTGLAVVLGTDDRGRLGVCTAPHCDRVYVDTSRNGSRRFCSTTCQNRVKTAAFRSRQT